MLPNHQAKICKGIVLERLEHLPPGGKMGDLPPHLQHKSFIRTGEKKTGGPNMRLIRLEDKKPSLTVTAHIFNKFVHPIENRYVTPREAATLQDFPLDYEFQGTLGEIHKQIGNAVPVKLATAIAKEVSNYLKSIGEAGIKTIASFFTGAGGLDLGFEAATDSQIIFETKFSNDIEHFAEKTINKNRPYWNFIRQDIRTISPQQIITAVNGKPDIIVGGPPCQPFSVAGKQKATDDPLGTLYRDFIRIIDQLRPKIVIMENVYGLAQVKKANMLDEIYKSFADIGYSVKHAELFSCDYGTPQKRRRLFFIATEKDLDKFSFPEPTHSETENLLGLPLYTGAGEILKKLPKPIYRD